MRQNILFYYWSLPSYFPNSCMHAWTDKHTHTHTVTLKKKKPLRNNQMYHSFLKMSHMKLKDIVKLKWQIHFLAWWYCVSFLTLRQKSQPSTLQPWDTVMWKANTGPQGSWLVSELIKYTKGISEAVSSQLNFQRENVSEKSTCSFIKIVSTLWNHHILKICSAIYVSILILCQENELPHDRQSI